MNHYYTSDNERVSKTYIDNQVKKAKARKLAQQIDDDGYNHCEKCGRSAGVYLDCSHDKSVDWCQKNRCSELAWDVDNITILCRECHQRKDGLDVRF